ncbi:MAG: transcriptional repressor AgaR [Salinivirgaceae bacterium]
MKEIAKKSTVDRRDDILNLLTEKGKVYVHELSEKYGVSVVTIRNDLEQLEKKNTLIRARGGAMKIEGQVAIDFNLSKKQRLYFNEKTRIGKKSAELVGESETIIIDSGTTTAEIAKNLATHKNITVITNAINIVNILANFSEINVIIPGGYLRKNSLSLVGPLAEKNFRQLYVDKAFIGVDGFDLTIGAFTPNLEEASLNQIMIEVAKEIIVVADSSKINRKSLSLICPLSNIHTLVTDSGISDADYKKLVDKGIKVIIA